MKSSRKQFLWIPLIALLSFIFYYIIYNNFHNDSGEQIFFSNILNGFMGAVVVALVTASIFIFQHQVQSEDEKNKSIYEKKLNLYLKISQLLPKIIITKENTPEISPENFEYLNEMYFEVFLIAGPETAKSFRSILEARNNLSNNDKTVIDDVYKNIDDFIHEARKDLEVLTNDNSQKSDFFKDSVVTIMKKPVKRKFSDEFKKQIVDEYNKADKKRDILQKYNVHYSQISDWKPLLDT